MSRYLATRSKQNPRSRYRNKEVGNLMGDDALARSSWTDTTGERTRWP